MRILKGLDEYIRNNGIPFRNFEINYSFFPTFFNHAIILKLREIMSERFEICGPTNYVLCYDDKNRLFLEVIGSDNRTRLLIYDDDDLYQYYPNTVGMRVYESKLHNVARTNMRTMDKRMKIREYINKKYDQKGFKLEKLKDEYEIMQIINDGDFIADDMYDDRYREEVNKSIKNITSYIDYLMKAYQEDLNVAYGDSIIDIKFTEPKTSTIIRKGNNKSGSISQYGRRNEVIPLSERMEALRRYPIKYFGKAYSHFSGNTEYYCAMYNDYEGRTLIVIEPVSGTSYTQIIYLDENTDYSQEEFSFYSQKYLELSYGDSLRDSRIIRFKHTDITDFKENIDVVINGTRSNNKSNAKVRRITDKIERI